MRMPGSERSCRPGRRARHGSITGRRTSGTSSATGAVVSAPPMRPGLAVEHDQRTWYVLERQVSAVRGGTPGSPCGTATQPAALARRVSTQNSSAAVKPEDTSSPPTPRAATEKQPRAVNIEPVAYDSHVLSRHRLPILTWRNGDGLGSSQSGVPCSTASDYHRRPERRRVSWPAPAGQHGSRFARPVADEPEGTFDVSIADSRT